MLETVWLRIEMQNRFVSMFSFSLLFSLVMIWFARTFIPLPVGVASAFLVSLAAAYPIVRYLKHEEGSESAMAQRLSEKGILARHERELGIYLSFFLGVTVAYIIMSFAFGPGTFETQLSAAQAISGAGGQGLSGQATGGLGFSDILANNLGVFAVTFILSLLISAGSVFILVWNASVLGVFLSSISENVLQAHATALLYLPHGLLEIGGYALAGIAASLLAYQLDRKLRGGRYARGAFGRVMEDCMVLTFIGVAMLVIGAVVEGV